MARPLREARIRSFLEGLGLILAWAGAAIAALSVVVVFAVLLWLLVVGLFLLGPA